MIPIIKVLNINRQTNAILENAYLIGYEKQVNNIWQASFSLPLDDPKVDKVKLLEYVEMWDDEEYIGLFRIIPKLTILDESKKEVKFQCEHVLATLMDKSLFKYWQRSNYTTEQNIDFLLAQQNHKHWVRRKCDFVRYFHYGWENTNLISALFSIPKPFNEQYLWDFDTQIYPWELDLIRPDTEPICRIQDGYNLIGLEIEENPMSQFNRIYPLGAGEGVNQLTIESVNDGLPYLEDRKPGEEIREYIWVDQRFTNADTLKSSAAALLEQFKNPIASWKVTAADLSKITGLSIDKFKIGKIVQVKVKGWPVTNLRIMKVSKPDIKGEPGNIQLELGSVQEDLATTQADLEHRQQINELYSQGATNILNFTYQDNCDETTPATIPFFVDDDVVNINTIELTYETKYFRTYADITKNAGQVIKTIATKNAGQVVKTITSRGGGQVVQAITSKAAGQSTQTSGQDTGYPSSLVSSRSGGPVTDSGGYPGESTSTFNDHRHWVTLDVAHFNHRHTVTTPAHTHGIDINLPTHTHAIDLVIEGHIHEIEFVLEGHIHEVNHKIVELDRLPKNVTIKVDGNVVNHSALTGDRINLVDYMDKDSSGKITRGKHVVEILPDDLGRIEANLILRVFIQSQLGGNF